jgi:hypothetical protein
MSWEDFVGPKIAECQRQSTKPTFVTMLRWFDEWKKRHA